LNPRTRDRASKSDANGECPADLETCRTTKTGVELVLRPVKTDDEVLLKDFFYALSDKSLHHRFLSVRKEMPREQLQKFVIVDYTREMAIIAIVRGETGEMAAGVGQYFIHENDQTAEVAFIVRDDYQNRGIGTELLKYLTHLAKRHGLRGFTAEVLSENERMNHMFERMGFDIQKIFSEGTFHFKMTFRTL
jgi:RimJ/RimL family protein N-acetyltransferase